MELHSSCEARLIHFQKMCASHSYYLPLRHFSLVVVNRIKIPLDPRYSNHKETVHKCMYYKHYLIVSVARYFDAGFSDFHINH